MGEGAPLAAVAERAHGTVVGDAGVVLTDVTHDSREAAEGSLFVAIRGRHHDGHDYVTSAVAKGASAVCVEHRAPVTVPQLIVGDGRRALAQAAAVVHDDPSHRVAVVGITGTDGKTTVTHLVESIARASGRVTATIGTLGAGVAGEQVATERTTPEASDLQRMLASMLRQRVELVVMEVSSHALALHRVDEVRFRIAAFTNLGRDHLDFHASVEDYLLVKERLFHSPGLEAAAVWIEDAGGRRIASRSPVPVLRVGRSPEADVWASALAPELVGTRFTLHLLDDRIDLRLPLGGVFNVENALVAAGCAHLCGFGLDEIGTGLEAAPWLPGRFEVLSEGEPFSVVVDYAHTPEGITTMVRAARAVTSGRVIVVFGAGGDRDWSKRPLMGRAAATADVVVVTSDNPRSEMPAEIIADVAAGVVAGGGDPLEVPDRRSAIRLALSHAHSGDTVLVLGKGHEQGQDLGDRIVPFDDRSVVREELSGP